MMLKFFLLFCVLYTAWGKRVNIKDEGYPSLKWPRKYNVEATKLYLSAGWVEELKYWRSIKSSRLDSNNGAVTKISRSTSLGKGTKYEIHPETTEEEFNEMVCYKSHGSMDNPVQPQDILPETYNFDEEAEEETVKGVDCITFTNNKDMSRTDTLMSLWAYYDNSTEAWVPVRYEQEAVDTWHGYYKDHVIWDFYNFEADVDMDVFKVEYECNLSKNDHDDEAFKSAAESLASLKSKETEYLNHEFTTYKRRFNKRYAHQAEHDMRKSIFHKNWRMVEDRNRQNLGYKLALNKFSDRTDKEMNKYRGFQRNKPRTVGNVAFPYTQETLKEIAKTLPTEYDLRLDGVVGPVLDQADCRSFWTFTATAVVEGALARSNGGTLIKLSNQALLDCSWGFGNNGCNGGNYEDSYKWIMEYGLPTEQEYGPYVTQEGFCDIYNMTTTYKIRGFTNVTPFSVEALKVAVVNHGPVVVSVHSTNAFEQYAGGIFYDSSCSSSPNKLNYEMTLVGYGEKDGDTFWILKNSRGPYWGLDGYIHISARDNNCGVATEPSYVVI